jgi:hypothetical protein
MSGDETSSLGVNVAAGVVYIAARRPDESLEVLKLEIAEHMDAAAGLRDFGERVAQELRRLQPSSVAIVEPKGRRQGWAYGEAFRRASLDTMVMSAAAQVGVPVERVATSHVIKALELDKEDPAGALEKRLGDPRPPYWSKAWLGPTAVRTL